MQYFSRTLAVKVSVLAAGLLAGVASAQDLTGVPNFHKVNPQIFRGAQPSAAGFQQLAKLGIKTVIDLREPGSRSLEEKKIVEAGGMRYVSVPMQGFHTPSADQIIKVLTIFNDSSAGPVFVHCRRGADRTGTVVACYRISHDRWENRRALEEARSLGMSWMQKALQSYVLQYKPGGIVAMAPEGSPAATPVPPTPAVTLAPIPAN
jgi:protein tyrosine/serine phosphatase